MFGLGMGEILLIAVIALVVLGPEQLPVVARTLGKLMTQIRDAKDQVTTSINGLAGEGKKVFDDEEIQVRKVMDDLKNPLVSLTMPSSTRGFVDEEKQVITDSEKNKIDKIQNKLEQTKQDTPDAKV